MPSEDPARRFRDIIESIDAIRDYIRDVDKETYLDGGLVRDAVERRLMVISEAARKLGPIAEAAAPELRWRAIRGFGNVARHAYDDVDAENTWLICNEHLDSLHTACRTAVAEIEPRQKPRDAP